MLQVFRQFEKYTHTVSLICTLHFVVKQSYAPEQVLKVSAWHWTHRRLALKISTLMTKHGPSTLMATAHGLHTNRLWIHVWTRCYINGLSLISTQHFFQSGYKGQSLTMMPGAYEVLPAFMHKKISSLRIVAMKITRTARMMTEGGTTAPGNSVARWVLIWP